jgi:hypothetical protein|tara:strand:+ start:173 stop:1423 length:1251 start_codon:yes stop_codon:yes gene_type:complete
MANILNGFLNNVLQGATNPGGNLKDYQHAARLFTDDGMRLAPKTKFLYHVVFELSPEAQKVIPQLDQRHKQEINMLVKSADLPKFSIQTATKNMYNRKKNLQTSIEYDPVNITFHDDNMGLTTTLMEAYYRYYFRDGNYRDDGINPPYNPRNTYTDPISQNYRYGLDNDHKSPFFNKITIYQMARHEYLGYTLVNPMVTGLTHDQVDSMDNSTPSQNQISIAYEAVYYSRGPVGENSPKGFATAHYDKTPSPLTLGGGGTSSLFGGGGVIGGISDVLGDIAGGTFNLGTALTAFNTFKNAKSLSKAGLREEGFNILKSTITNIGRENVGGLSNISIPKSSGNGGNASITSTVGGTVDTSSLIYGQRITQAAANNSTTAGATSFANDAQAGTANSFGTSTTVGANSGSTLQAGRNGP